MNFCIKLTVQYIALTTTTTAAAAAAVAAVAAVAVAAAAVVVVQLRTEPLKHEKCLVLAFLPLTQTKADIQQLI